jgi:ABC-2 type transport system ATP-binding protein
VLEFRDLRRRFGDVVALDGLTFRVQPGELCGFLGPNGAGKTTAMRCAVGVTAPDAGEVRWRGAPIDLAVRRRTGYMPEERGLYPKMRVHEQLVYLGQLHGMAADAAGRSADRWIERLGLRDRRDDAVEQLSLGNQQRVQLAAALVHDPDLLVLDEPFSGLDPLATDVMSAVLRERADAGVAVVFSSHQLDLVEDLCRTVAVIARGRLVLEGAVAALRAAGGRRLRVEVEGGDGWTAGLPTDVAVVHRREGTVTVALPAGTDPGQVLDVARRHGALLDVHLDQPRLSELFRTAVAGRPDLGPAPGSGDGMDGGPARDHREVRP